MRQELISHDDLLIIYSPLISVKDFFEFLDKNKLIKRSGCKYNYFESILGLIEPFKGLSMGQYISQIIVDLQSMPDYDIRLKNLCKQISQSFTYRRVSDNELSWTISVRASMIYMLICIFQRFCVLKEPLEWIELKDRLHICNDIRIVERKNRMKRRVKASLKRKRRSHD
jgi:hypothetical protein